MNEGAPQAQPPESIPPSTPVAPSTDPNQTSTVVQPGGMPDPAASAGASAPVTPPAEAPMTDEQILAVLEAANAKEVEEAQVAQTKAKNKDVKAFAKKMTQHHNDAKAKQAKLVQKLGITASESDKSKQLKDEARQAVEQLKSTQGTEFDQQFMAIMVKDHQATLDLLDQKILPMTKNAELRAMIENDLRPTVEKHLKEAQAIAQKLDPAGTGIQTGQPGQPGNQMGMQPGQPGNQMGVQPGQTGNQMGQTGATPKVK